MRFIAVDLETANPRMSSICQIGIVTFENGVESNATSILLDPQDYFDPYHVDIHGINEAAVRGAPTFGDVYSRICEIVDDVQPHIYVPFWCKVSGIGGRIFRD